eukprot:1583560-Rhodomonas_salina.2
MGVWGMGHWGIGDWRMRCWGKGSWGIGCRRKGYSSEAASTQPQRITHQHHHHHHHHHSIIINNSNKNPIDATTTLPSDASLSQTHQHWPRAIYAPDSLSRASRAHLSDATKRGLCGATEWLMMMWEWSLPVGSLAIHSLDPHSNTRKA